MSTSGVLVDRPVVDELGAACDELARADVSAVWRLADADVERGVSLLLRLQAHTAALQAILLAEVESRDLKATTGAPSTPRWLGDRWRLSRTDGGARLRESAALRRHPQLLAALGSGAVTVEQAQVLAAVLHEVAGLPGVGDGEVAAAAEFLLAQCTQLGPRELGRAGQAVVETLTRTPSVDDPAEAAAVAREQQRAERDLQHAEQNWLRVTHRPGGRVRIGADLGPVGAAAFLAWCRHTDVPVPGTDGFEDTRTRAERRGDALADLFHHGTDRDRAPVPADHPSHVPADDTDEIGLLDTDRIDSLEDDSLEDDSLEDDSLEDDSLEDDSRVDGPGLFADPAEAVPDRHDSGAAPAPGQWPGVVLTLVTTLEELRAGIPGTGRLDTGAPLSAAALRQLACEAQVVPAVMNGPSQVLDLGRCCRPFNRAQRRAAALRDRGCVAPGCDAPPAACHLHHSRWWSRGGPTDLDNAALLCGFHHRMVHRQDWAITLAPNGYPQLHPPPTIDPTGRARQHHRFTVDAAISARPRAADVGAIAPHPRT